jgi:hypothetical protein
MAPAESWLARMLERKPPMVAAFALANKMARGIWAMLTRGEDYRGPVLSAPDPAAREAGPPSCEEGMIRMGK